MPREGKLQIVKYAPPPLELPVLGSVSPEQISYIGRTNYIAALDQTLRTLIVVLPGENYSNPGASTFAGAVTGAPITQTANTPFVIKKNEVTRVNIELTPLRTSP